MNQSNNYSLTQYFRLSDDDVPATIHESQAFTKNKEKYWFFHPGKLRFYSCKGCGGDEYYQCCLMCSK